MLHTDEPRAAQEERRAASRRRPPRRRFPLALWDTLAAAAVIAAGTLVGVARSGPPLSLDRVGELAGQILPPALLAPVALAAVGVSGLEALERSRAILLARLLLVGGFVAMLAAWLMSFRVDEPLGVGRVALVASGLTLTWLVGRWLASTTSPTERVLVVGTGQVARQIGEQLHHRSARRVEVIGYLDDASDSREPEVRVLGTLSELRRVVAQERVDRVIVTFSIRPDAELVQLLRECDGLGVRIDVVPRFFDLVGRSASARSLGPLPLLDLSQREPALAARALKRGIDLAAGAALLIATLPLMAVIALALALDDGRPLIFRQRRPGRDGDLFTMLKFRTLARGAERAGRKVAQATLEDGGSVLEASMMVKAAGAARASRLGRVLRRTSLDELPQLWNVLRGDMSLVGPRPLLPFEYAALPDWARRRHGVRPGITGSWQTLGRNEIGWDERMLLDYSYARDWTFGTDMRILTETPRAVLQRRGAL